MFKGLVSSGNSQSEYIAQLEETVASQQKKLEKYEKKLKDLVVAYRSVCEERDVLSQVISAGQDDNSVLADNRAHQEKELVVRLHRQRGG